MQDRRLDKGKATRDRLVVTARALFGERGYENTSIEAILEATGIARGALYHHFAGKEAVFDAVLDGLVAEIAAAAADAARASDDPVRSLREGFASWLRTALDPAVQRIVLLDSPSVVGWARLREIDEQRTLAGIKATLRQLADQRRIAAGDVDLLAHMLLAAVNEAALLIAQADDPQSALVAGQATIDRLLDRLFADPSDGGRIGE
jgi:AcrR family transcriptional regulator